MGKDEALYTVRVATTKKEIADGTQSKTELMDKEYQGRPWKSFKEAMADAEWLAYIGYSAIIFRGDGINNPMCAIQPPHWSMRVRIGRCELSMSSDSISADERKDLPELVKKWAEGIRDEIQIGEPPFPVLAEIETGSRAGERILCTVSARKCKKSADGKAIIVRHPDSGHGFLIFDRNGGGGFNKEYMERQADLIAEELEGIHEDQAIFSMFYDSYLAAEPATKHARDALEILSWAENIDEVFKAGGGLGDVKSTEEAIKKIAYWAFGRDLTNAVELRAKLSGAIKQHETLINECEAENESNNKYR